MFELLFGCNMFWPFFIKGIVSAVVIGAVALFLSKFSYHDESDEDENQ